jgi:hypothetical protein
MLAQATVTQGYLWAAVLVMMLYAALKTGRAWFKLEQALALALGLGLFIVAMAVLWPSLFPAVGGTVGGYAGL